MLTEEVVLVLRPTADFVRRPAISSDLAPLSGQAVCRHERGSGRVLVVRWQGALSLLFVTKVKGFSIQLLGGRWRKTEPSVEVL